MLHRRAFLVALLGAVLLAAMISTAGAKSTHRPAVTVSPSVGGPHGRFTVSFHAPQAAGQTAVARSSYVISASTHAASGCRSSLSHTVWLARKGQAERVRLSAGSGHRLCVGTYKGSVMLVRAPVCGPPTQIACPLFAAVSQRVGTFRFRVK